MPIDPAEERRFGEKFDLLDRRTDELYTAANRLNQRCVALNARLRAVEGRNKLLWGLCVTLFIALLGSIGTSIYRGGVVDSEVRHAAEANAATNAAVKELAKEFREHERQAGTPKNEPPR